MDSATEQKYKDILRTASVKIKELQDEVDLIRREPIAIIGMGCRYPGGANDPKSFWNILKNSVDCTREVPADRWQAETFTDPRQEAVGKTYTSAGGYLDTPVSLFDAGHFNISPKEAAGLDPQQRLLLEVSWEALEDAGINADTLKGSKTGVYIGTSSDDYAQAHRHSGDLDRINGYSITGTTFSTAVGRVSYFFGLEGPNMAIDTACSSSLVSLHVAAQSLRSGETNLALVGGVNMLLAPAMHICFSKLQALAPDGKCKTFDEAANGYVRGEGCGVVVLKRLRDAVIDRDNILAVVRGSAVNQDGKSNGLTAPNGRAQQKVINEALANAGLTGADISYVETHGTGTALGDPVEVEALGRVLGKGRTPQSKVVLGALKTNIGHLEPAAGVAGMMKIIQSMKNEAIPANLNFQKPSPFITWDAYPFTVPTSMIPWPKGDSPRRAAISGFGFSGTNAHVILEEPPTSGQEEVRTERPYHLLCLSAKSDQALADLAAKYIDHLTECPASNVGDLCHTANTGRVLFDHRLAVVGQTPEELRSNLQAYVANPAKPIENIVSGKTADAGGKIAMLFSGQGAQYAGMGRTLYQSQPFFKQEMDRCAELLAEQLDTPLLDLLFNGEENQLLNETINTQPALFALEYCLAKLWISWGIKPDMVMGHSVGEYVAACLAGVFTLEDGLKLIVARARLMHSLPQDGAMVAILTDEQRVQAVIAGHSAEVAIAAVNGPESIVISGNRQAVEEISAAFQDQGIDTRPLKVSHAFHSPLMEPILAEFAEIAATISYSAPSLPLVSNLTGKLVQEEITTPEYWQNHIRQAVRFNDSMVTLAEQGCNIFLEMGPKPVLVGMGRFCLADQELTWLASLRQGKDDWQQLLIGLAGLHIQGVKINWQAFDQDYDRKRLALPTYPFQRQEYWLQPIADAGASGPTIKSLAASHPLLGHRLQTAALPDTWLFESRLTSTTPGYLQDHRVFEATVFPAAGYLEMALAAGAEFFKTTTLSLADVTIHKGLILPEDSEISSQLILSPADQQSASFKIFTQPKDSDDMPWTLHSEGTIRSAEAQGPEKINLQVIHDLCPESLPPAELYASFASRHIDFGPRFQTVQEIWRGENQSIGLVELPSSLSATAHTFHPSLLDGSCFQMLGASLFDDTTNETYLPVAIASLELYASPQRRLWSHVELLPALDPQADIRHADVSLYGEDGSKVARATGVTVQRTGMDVLSTRESEIEEWLYDIDWVRIEAPALPEETPEPGTWLIFSAKQELDDQLRERLESKGQRCLMIEEADRYSCIQANHYTINHNDPEHFQRLIKEALNTQPFCRGVIFLSALASPATSDLDTASLSLAQETNCAGLLHLVQALAAAELPDSPQLFVVTRAAQYIPDNGQDRVEVAQSSLWGFGRVIALEHPELQCRRLDLAPEPGHEDAEIILNEILGPGGESQVAWRNSSRFAARLKRCGFEAAQAEPAIRPDASYLITGGLGALGGRVALWLLEQGARNLILTGRSGADSDKAKDLVRWLENLGATVQVIAADVAVEEDVIRIFKDAEETMPPICGIIHTAGVLVEGVIQQQNWPRFQQVLAPKIQGAWNLHSHSLDLELDLFVCFSSIIALLGSMGQTSYAAANAFMDGLVHHRRQNGLAGLTINWGAWDDDGMAARAPEQWKQRIVNSGIGIMEPDKAIQVFAKIVGAPAAQVAVVPIQWPTFLGSAAVTDPFFNELHDTDQAANHGRQVILDELSAAPAQEAKSLLDTYVRKQVAEVLCLPSVDQIEPARKLVHLGFDSLMAVDLKNRLAKSFQYQLPTALLFEEPSTNDLVDHLAAEILPGLALGGEDMADNTMLEEASL